MGPSEEQPVGRRAAFLMAILTPAGCPCRGRLTTSFQAALAAPSPREDRFPPRRSGIRPNRPEAAAERAAPGAVRFNSNHVRGKKRRPFPSWKRRGVGSVGLAPHRNYRPSAGRLKGEVLFFLIQSGRRGVAWRRQGGRDGRDIRDVRDVGTERICVTTAAMSRPRPSAPDRPRGYLVNSAPGSRSCPWLSKSSRFSYPPRSRFQPENRTR